MSSERTVPLSDTEMAAWRALVTSQVSVTRRLENDLQREHRMSLAAYEVLVHLSEAPQQALRMTELAERLMLSRSGLTRLVDRLVDAGWVQRAKCATDARGWLTVLTRRGEQQLRKAYPTHLRGVREYVVDRLAPREQRELARALGRLAVAVSEGSCEPSEN
ncbi:MAG: MarR family winged helix-turn-helix transcriptional regulator [Mycobacteriales bacterium]|nr:MarR family transcriptional regulator [Frankia sp.]